MRTIVLQYLAGIVLLSSFVLLAPQLAGATEEYARQTGQTCSVCHLDPGGGGELTAGGKTFAGTRPAKTDGSGRGVILKGFRLAIGYIHFLTAIFWFGTILYVHLILKPAYAAGGLPRGELRVGIVSMVVMAITLSRSCGACDNASVKSLPAGCLPMWTPCFQKRLWVAS